MTILQQEALEAALNNENLDERILVSPLLSDKQIGPASIDLRLGTEFLLPRRVFSAGLDPGKSNERTVEARRERLVVPLGESLWLHPQQFVLGSTLEYVRLPNKYAAYVVGRSSWGRLGLIVATAIMVQPGYGGILTFELANAGDSPIKLYPGLRIAQLAVHTLQDETEHGYQASGGKYPSPTGPEETKLAWEQDEIERLQKIAAAMHQAL